MTTEIATTDFLKLLKTSDLIPSDHFDRVVDQLKLGALASADEIARTLVRNRVITPFQSERLLAGRARGFYIDSYKVLEILGVGGMGCIYIAEDSTTRKRVALKVLTTRHEVDTGMRARFELEARAGLKLHHENVCRTLYMGDTGAITYMAMEFFKGVSLHEVIALGGKIPSSQACDLFMQAAIGLHHAHERGLVHRDVKPANLLVDKDGQLKILDFGLALLTDDPDAEFSLQMIFGHDCLGTADFIAPEQSLNSSQVDARADVYSLGCTMYLALTGKFPFPYQHTSQKLEAHRTKRAIAIRELNPEVPEAVAAIVEKMMRKRPEQRYADCLEVAQELEIHASRQPVNFDFQKILSMRIAETKLREQALHIGQTSATGGSSGRRLDSSRRRLQESIETVVAKDTKPVRGDRSSGIGLESSAQIVTDQVSRSIHSNLPSDPDATRRLVATDTSQVFPMSGASVVIGRDATCSICIPDKSISTRHCELRPKGDEWVVVDLGSETGLAINGTPTRKHTLTTGDRITVGGRVTFLYSEVPYEDEGFPTWFWVAGGVAIAAAIGGICWWLLG